jgi:hypothetical protein
MRPEAITVSSAAAEHRHIPLCLAWLRARRSDREGKSKTLERRKIHLAEFEAEL